jgi:hypothetical protein
MAKARWLGGLAGVLLLLGCGEQEIQPSGETASGGQATQPPGETAGGDEAAPVPLGWSVRDTSPYARASHSMVIDQAGDRMILFGGQGNDAWELPLSGPEANRWQLLSPEGERPPPGDASAVYDAVGQRILARFDRGPSGGYTTGEIWELALLGPPTWRRLAPSDERAEQETARGVVALDAAGGRLFVAGGMGGHCGTWVLSLRGEPEWERWGDAPVAECSAGAVFLPEFNEGTLIFDAPRERLVAFTSELGVVWQMPLETRAWSRLPGRLPISFGQVAMHDEQSERVLLAGDTFSSYSLATSELVELRPQPVLPLFAGAVHDTERGRIVLFPSGEDDGTYQLSIDEGEVSPLVRGTLGPRIDPAETLVWDQRRRGVVALGGTIPEAQQRPLAPGAAWTKLEGGPAPALFSLSAVYDSANQAVLTFGGHDFLSAPTSAVWRLSSEPGSSWQVLTPSTDGPEPRGFAATDYDPRHQRLLVRGGTQLGRGADRETFDDFWTFSINDKAWEKLAPGGQSPGPRSAEAGSYDPEGQRWFAYGGYLGDEPQNDVHLLTLNGEPTWTKLEVHGSPPAVHTPPASASATAVYEAARDRLVLVVPRDQTTEVFALELSDRDGDGDEPRWHRFCDLGPSPNPGLDQQRAVLTSDGILLAISNGAFRFNLETPYCD